MNQPAFFDTNILVYSDDSSVPAKQERAATLLAKHVEDESAIFSLQVLQEYFNTVTRKLGISPDMAQRKVEVLARRRVVCFQPHDIIAAIELHRLTSISFWDALIVHAARISGASVLYSEDLQPGSRIGGVRVVNPFD